jgi:hypothetical protein
MSDGVSYTTGNVSRPDVRRNYFGAGRFGAAFSPQLPHWMIFVAKSWPNRVSRSGGYFLPRPSPVWAPSQLHHAPAQSGGYMNIKWTEGSGLLSQGTAATGTFLCIHHTVRLSVCLDRHSKVDTYRARDIPHSFAF